LKFKPSWEFELHFELKVAAEVSPHQTGMPTMESQERVDLETRRKSLSEGVVEPGKHTREGRTIDVDVTTVAYTDSDAISTQCE